MLDSSLVEPIDAMPEYMHEPLKTCGLAGRGLRLYCTALRSLIDDPPLVGYIDLRSMGLRTLTKLACKCSIPVNSAVRWEQADNIRKQIESKAATPQGEFVLKHFQSELVKTSYSIF